MGNATYSFEEILEAASLKKAAVETIKMIK